MHRSPPPRASHSRTRQSTALAAAIVAGAALVTPLATGAPAGAATVPRAALPPGKIGHIVVIDLENEGFAATFGTSSPATYLNHVLLKKGELIANYFGTGHNSLDNYIAQVSGQSPTTMTQGDCVGPFVSVTPGTPTANGQVQGNGCVYPAAVPTIASQLDAKYPPNPKTHVAAWREYAEDMGNTPARDGGVVDPTGGTDCGHPAIGGTTAIIATPVDQYATRHDPMVWFHSIIDNTTECNANVVPLGTLTATGAPSPTSHLVRDFSHAKTTPRFAFITPNLCDDGHDSSCAGTNSAGTKVGGLAGADAFLQHWMPVILGSPAYRSGNTLVVVTFDEADAGTANGSTSCCGEVSGPNTAAPGNAGATSDAAAPGGGQVGAVLLNPKYLVAGSVDTTGSYNHYSALRSYEDLLGLTTGGTDGHGHLGYAAAPGLKPFGKDVFNH